MKILIAPDKFKGSLTAVEVCNAIEEGVLRYNPNSEIAKLPLADGGEGTLDVLESSLNFKKIEKEVTGPRFNPVKAYYGFKQKTAYIEMAQASGLMLLESSNRHTPFTTTLGTGELIKDALEKGAKKIYLFVGGSATNDAGIGMAHALGYRFLDKSGKVLKPIGNSLIKIDSISGTPNKKIKNTEFIIVSDVRNPLHGKNGAAMVFAKQKGANDREIENLDKGLKNFAKIAEKEFKKTVSQKPGAGAAGGLGAGAVLFLGAKIKNGIQTVMDILNFDVYINEADFVISGEGKFDFQTLEGKAVKGVIDKCNRFKKPLGIVCGISELNLADLNMVSVKMISPLINSSIDEANAVKNAFKLVSSRTHDMMNVVFGNKKSTC